MPMEHIRMTWPMYQLGACRFCGRLVRLTRSEADLVAALLLRRGQLMPLNDVIETMWDADDEPETAVNVVHVILSRVRRKLPGLIETWWGRGLRIALPGEKLSRAA